MLKQFTITILGYSLTLQVRQAQARTRKEDFVIEIDHAKKQETIDSLNLDDIRSKARAMRKIHEHIHESDEW
jgi:hypothetical protein